jgi:ubiquinone/menaquinone biosynthesis C-methylase UbiE
MTAYLIDKEIDDFYSKTSEQDRLNYGLGPLEFERNKDLIKRFLPETNSVIVDIGGGPGIYSEWLAILGQDVILVDPVEKHVQQAKKRSSKLKKTFRCLLGEARHLDLPDNSADLAIIHGPLYHLQERQERINALTEAKRVLKPEGMLLGFAINYTASTLVGLIQGAMHSSDFFDMCKTELLTGNHMAPGSMPGILPKAFYHKPQELKEEIEEAGFSYVDTFAVEGIVWLEKNYFDTWYNQQKKKTILELLKITETDKNLLALSPHMMIAAKKPGL